MINDEINREDYDSYEEYLEAYEKRLEEFSELSEEEQEEIINLWVEEQWQKLSEEHDIPVEDFKTKPVHELREQMNHNEETLVDKIKNLFGF